MFARSQAGKTLVASGGTNAAKRAGSEEPVAAAVLGNHSMQRLRAKLAVSQPGDAFEQEADVLRLPDAPAPLQRRPDQGARRGPGGPPHMDSEISGLRGRGRPLPEPVRAFFEPRFGQDFQDIRIHTGVEARSAHGIQALAYTAGSDIVFGDGQYAPERPEGKRLLAHELAHVIQQQHAPATIQRWAYGAGSHNTSGGATFREITPEERRGANGTNAAMALVDRLVTGTNWRARNCQKWFTDNCLDARTLPDLHARAVLWMWREADGSSGLGLTDGGDGTQHAVTEQLFRERDRWALAATIIHEYWHDCDTGAPADIGDDAKAACGLPNI